MAQNPGTGSCNLTQPILAPNTDFGQQSGAIA